MTTEGASVTVSLSDAQARATVVALRDRLFETERYISGGGFTPCHPTCEHCLPKVAHFAKIQAGLIERKKTIQSVLALLDGAESPSRKGEQS
jgi:hypothetical protein